MVAVPVDVSRPWAMGTAGTAHRARDGGASLVGDPPLDLSNDLAHHDARSPLGGVRHHVTQAHQRADQVNIGLDRIEQLRLQQHRGEMQPLDGISLHHLDHAGRKVGPDVAEPAGDPRRGRAEAARSARSRCHPPRPRHRVRRARRPSSAPRGSGRYPARRRTPLRATAASAAVWPGAQFARRLSHGASPE